MDSLPSKPVGPALLWAGAWAALAWAAPARADMITPNSIPQPPPVFSYSNQTWIPIPSSADLVTAQYTGRGLLFPSLPIFSREPLTGLTAAIANLGGVDVWSPAVLLKGESYPAALVSNSSLTVQFVKPGGTTPATANSVTVEVLAGRTDLMELEVYDRSGAALGWTRTAAGTGPHGGVLLTLSAPDISSFQVFGAPSIFDASPWGVAEIDFTPAPGATAPEPCGLALAGVGAAALAVCTGRRRRAARPPRDPALSPPPRAGSSRGPTANAPGNSVNPCRHEWWCGRI